MLLNYLVIALRNISKYKVFSSINIAGMAISLASCILILLYVWDELHFDNYHPDGDRTYRVYNITDHGGVKSYLPIVPYPFASYMQKDFPEIESTLRILDTYGELLFEYNGKRIMEKGGVIAEPTLFDMLSIQVLEGDAKTALVNPNMVAISRNIAQKYFGSESALGKTIKIDEQERQVSAVFEDLHANSHAQITFAISFSSTQWSQRFESNWLRQQIFTYIKLKPGADAQALDNKLKPFVEKYAYPSIQSSGITYVPHLQNIQDIHLHSSNFEWEMARRGDAQSVYILMVTAALIIIIASLNFINLSTARAVKRMKEVGVRKVSGAHRGQLIFQFISESIVYTLAGFIIGITLAELGLPYMNDVMEKNLSIPYSVLTLSIAAAFCVLLGAIAGSYPAFLLSSYKPAMALTKKNDRSTSGLFRQSLVTLQFMFSFFLISGSAIVLSQNDLIHSKDLGFDKEQILVVPLRGPQLNNQEATKERYLAHPNVISATIGFGLPGDIIAGDGVIEPVTKTNISTSMMTVDFDYITTLGMHIVAGRDFDRAMATDSAEAFIINETAVRTFGFGTPQEAIGRRLDWESWSTDKKVKKGKIIGVVKDFHFKSLREKLSPCVMQIFPGSSWKLAARISPGDIDETIAHFKKTYESLDPDWAFTYSFLDQNFDEMYKSERRLGKLFSFFTVLAIVVACLGLFGLVEFSVNQRTKELSIRKVFGASTTSLVMLLTRKYFGLLLAACLLVVPLVYYLAGEWLNKFAYRIEISPTLFVRSVLLIATVTAVTVSYQAIKAALSNPVNNLRND